MTVHLMTANQSITHADRSSGSQTRSETGPTSVRPGSRGDQGGSDDERRHQPDGEDVLSLLGDEYVTDIVEALADGPKPARVLADRCGMSRATVYRRLERLSDVGLVTSRPAIERDGHHRQQFRLVLDELQIEIGEDGFDCTLSVGDPSRS